MEQRRLAVDLAEVIIKWEFQRAREAQEMEVRTVYYICNNYTHAWCTCTQYFTHVCVCVCVCVCRVSQWIMRG